MEYKDVCCKICLMYEQILGAEVSATDDDRNSLLWQTLMQTVENTQDLTLVDDLPKDRSQLILTDADEEGKRYLITINEIKGIARSGLRVELSNPPTQLLAPLIRAEKEQVKKKDQALWGCAYAKEN